MDMQALKSERMRMHEEALETNASALRRSFEAESALQAEVALLRERNVQLTTQLDEQRRVFVTGVQQMLDPLSQYLGAGGVPVPFSDVIPQALRLLEAVKHPPRARAVAPEVTRRDLEEVAKRTDDLRGVVHSCTRRLAAVERLLKERLPLVADAPSDDQSPQTYDTFVMSDRQAADIERAILSAQTRTGRPYGG